MPRVGGLKLLGGFLANPELICRMESHRTVCDFELVCSEVCTLGAQTFLGRAYGRILHFSFSDRTESAHEMAFDPVSQATVR